MECCQQKAGDYMLATTKIIRLFAKKGEIQIMSAKKNRFVILQKWQLGTALEWPADSEAIEISEMI